MSFAEVSSNSNSGRRRVVEDTARTHTIVTVVHGHVDVTINTPPGAPGVSDDEDLLAVHDLPADSSDGVVKIVVVWAVSGGHNTTTVAHERTVSLNSEGDRTNAKSFLNRFGISIDVIDVISCNSLGRSRNIARSLFASVWVVSRQNDGGLSCTLVHTNRPATVATVATTVIILAVNNLLLGERHNLCFSLNGQSRLEDSHSGEGVARTTLTLVLDRNDNVVTPDEFAVRSRTLSWIRVGFIIIIFFLFLFVLLLIGTEATFDGSLSDGSILHDAHPPGVKVILGPSFFVNLLVVLLTFLISQVLLVLLVELIIKPFAGLGPFIKLLVVEILVLFSGHIKAEAIPVSLVSKEKSIVVINLSTVNGILLFLSHIRELVVTELGAAVLVSVMALVVGLLIEPVGVAHSVLFIRNPVLTVVGLVLLVIILSGSEEGLELSLGEGSDIDTSEGVGRKTSLNLDSLRGEGKRCSNNE